jgi:hypothetical protein
MFQLIISVVSASLAAFLAVASIFYAGNAFHVTGVKANAAVLINGGGQISAAQRLYTTDNGAPATSISGLTTSVASGQTYLAAPPALPLLANGPWVIDSTGAYATVSFSPDTERQADVCAEVSVALSAGVNPFGCGTLEGTGVVPGTSGFWYRL